MRGPISPAVISWWATISLVSAGNIVVWLRARRRLARAEMPAAQLADERRQLVLSGLFTFICAFRSFLPRADVQRICLVDSWFSTVLVGRTVATVAELAFMAQVAGAVGGIARRVQSPSGILLSRVMVPMIAVAESCSWYAVVTTNFLGNSLEESIWMLTSLLVAVQLLVMSRRTTGRLRRFQLIAAGLALCHVAFEALIDVPMYVTRYLSDERAGKVYLHAGAALHDLATRWVVTYRWSDWHDELAWMGLYFTAAVWGSLALINAPRLWHEPGGG